MNTDGCASGWLLFLAQLPKTPSSARVALWRRLRAAGSTTMVNGAWVLPETASHTELFGQLRDRVLRQGGTAFVLNILVPSPEVNETIIARFRADRGREYDEFAERCTALLDEVGKEAGAGKYTFAEMEENEQDLEKLVRWLAKIQARDFFPDERGQQAAAVLARCQNAVDAFSQAVYAAEEGPGYRRPRSSGGRRRGHRETGLDPADVNGERLAGIQRRERFVHDEGAV
jgi:hypothetical protein